MSNMEAAYFLKDKSTPIIDPNVTFDTTYVIAATVIAGILVVTLIYWLLNNIKKPVPVDFVGSSQQSRQPSSSGRRNQSFLRTSNQISDDDSNEDLNEAKERIKAEYQSKKKIGVKKLAKLEMKAEKRVAREAMLQEREEKKREQEYKDHLRKQEEEKEAELEKQKEEEDRLEKKRKAEKEHEEYLEITSNFEVEEEGYDQETGHDNEEKLSEFINFIRDRKIVQLEDLASQFKLKTTDVVDRVQGMLENGSLTGIIDDRGKFISITVEELESVAKFIRQRGRVTVKELVVNSNRLIDLK